MKLPPDADHAAEGLQKSPRHLDVEAHAGIPPEVHRRGDFRPSMTRPLVYLNAAPTLNAISVIRGNAGRVAVFSCGLMA